MDRRRSSKPSHEGSNPSGVTMLTDVSYVVMEQWGTVRLTSGVYSKLEDAQARLKELVRGVIVKVTVTEQVIEAS